MTLIADAKTKVYGDADPSLTYQVSGLKNGDTAGAVLNGGTALSNRLCWMQQAYGLGVGDTVLQKTPFSFDVSVWEFLPEHPHYP